MLSNPQKAKIHIATQQIGMTDDEYRALLSRWGANSCTELGQHQYRQIMAHFRHLGFKDLTFRPGPRKPKFQPAREKVVAKTADLLNGMSLPWQYADEIAARMFSVEHIGQCEPWEIAFVNQKLQKIAKWRRDEEVPHAGRMQAI